MKLKGLIPPMVTPATDDGLSVDRTRLQALTRWLLDAGVDGLFVGATAGEAAMLDRTQRRIAVETVAAEVNGRVPVIAGASAQSTARAMQYARDAQEAGANYIMILPPGVFPVSEDEMIHHFALVADAVSIPTLLYNFPAITVGQPITAKILAAVTQRAQVVGIKDSSGDLTNTRAYRLACGDSVSLLIGADRLVFSHLELGGDGTICAGLNLSPKTYIALYRAFQAGDRVKALALQDAVMPNVEICLVGTFPAGLKEGLRQQGVDPGPPFLPVSRLSAAGAARVAQLIGQVNAASRDLGIGA